MSHTPPEGIYLDATLDLVAGRVLDRIDKHERRRKTHRRLLVGVLAGVVALSGTAAAIVGPRLWEANRGEQLYHLNCIEGAGMGQYPYFGVEFRIEGQLDTLAIDPIALCSRIWNRTMQARLGPPNVSVEAANLDDAAKLLAPTDVVVDTMSTGPIERPYSREQPQMAACFMPDTNYLIVLSAEAGEARVSTADWSTRCARNYGYELWTVGAR